MIFKQQAALCHRRHGLASECSGGQRVCTLISDWDPGVSLVPSDLLGDMAFAARYLSTQPSPAAELLSSLGPAPPMICPSPYQQAWQFFRWLCHFLPEWRGVAVPYCGLTLRTVLESMGGGEVGHEVKKFHPARSRLHVSSLQTSR